MTLAGSRAMRDAAILLRAGRHDDALSLRRAALAEIVSEHLLALGVPEGLGPPRTP